MRTRKEIEETRSSWSGSGGTVPGETILEVLLDIRDLLSQENKIENRHVRYCDECGCTH